MFIVYDSNDEILVTTLKEEQETLKVWFTEGGRNLEDYDRYITDSSTLRIGSRLRLDSDKELESA